jgi:hypothetical protein
MADDSLTNETKPKDRLAIYEESNELVDSLTVILHVESQLGINAQAY